MLFLSIDPSACRHPGCSPCQAQLAQMTGQPATMRQLASLPCAPTSFPCEQETPGEERSLGNRSRAQVLLEADKIVSAMYL